MNMNLNKKIIDIVFHSTHNSVCESIVDRIFLDHFKENINVWQEVRKNLGHEMFMIWDFNILKEIKFDLEDYEF